AELAGPDTPLQLGVLRIEAQAVTDGELDTAVCDGSQDRLCVPDGRGYRFLEENMYAGRRYLLHGFDVERVRRRDDGHVDVRASQQVVDGGECLAVRRGRYLGGTTCVDVDHCSQTRRGRPTHRLDVGCADGSQSDDRYVEVGAGAGLVRLGGGCNYFH